MHYCQAAFDNGEQTSAYHEKWQQNKLFSSMYMYAIFSLLFCLSLSLFRCLSFSLSLHFYECVRVHVCVCVYSVFCRLFDDALACLCISAAFENVGNLLTNADSSMKVEEAKVSQAYAPQHVHMPESLYKLVSLSKNHTSSHQTIKPNCLMTSRVRPLLGGVL